MITALPVAPALRFHLSLNVANLERSVAFYRILFGREPAKCRPDYAKFELDDPPLVLSLEPTPRGAGGALNHLGFRMPDAEALVAMQMRLEQAGFSTRREEGVECCYARQTKFWITDPDQTLWEIYTLDEDIDHRGTGQSLERMLPPQEKPEAQPVVWEHRLGDTVPAALPLVESTADEVRLRGTFNMDLQEPQYSHLLAAAWRALRPGGVLVVHTLVADRPFPHGMPQLPGPAGRVQRIPLESEPMRAVEEAGFVELHLAKFAAGPCFQHDGVQMREMLLSASKPAPASVGRKHLVLYKGPFRELRDDDGTVYLRGQRTEVSEQTQARLRQGACAEQFLFLS
jgi:catechol 2,3-dioxygenase-like lactoylglutathione lyase family enzyme